MGMNYPHPAFGTPLPSGEGLKRTIVCFGPSPARERDGDSQGEDNLSYLSATGRPLPHTAIPLEQHPGQHQSVYLATSSPGYIVDASSRRSRQ
jgi:hypothetical protein